MRRYSTAISTLFLFALSLSGQGIWERRADYPVLATEVSSAAIDGKVYSVCGLSPANSLNSLFIYDPATDTWRPGAPSPIPGGGDHCNVAAAGGKFYLLGAIRIGSSFVDGNTYEYDPGTDQWQTVGRMPTPRGASGVAAIGSTIYVAGGLNPGQSVATFEVFDTVTRQWSRLPDMPTARDHLTAQSVNGRLHAIAGRVGDVLNANEEYDPATNIWRRRAPIPTPRGGLASGTINNRIQVFGGEGPSGTPEGTYRQNEEYDPAADTWRSLAPMLTPRHGLYGAAANGRIFAPSGGPMAGAFFSNVHEAFFLPPDQPPAIDAVRNAASFAPALAPGAVISLFGKRLSQGEQMATKFPLPGQMNAVVVRANGAAVPLLYVGPDQINFHLPYTFAAGPLRVTVTNAGSESPAIDAGTLAETAPGIFTLGGNQGAILIAGTALIARAAGDGSSRPARKGEVVEIYATGLGSLSDPPGPGMPAPSLPTRTVQTPQVTIGGTQAEVLFSGLATGLVGVYQVNARVPDNAMTGQVPVTIRMGDRVSNEVTLAIME